MSEYARRRRLRFETLEDRRLLTVPATDWSATFGGDSYEEARSVAETRDGGFIAAGWTRSFSASEDGYVVKTDGRGRLEWERSYGGDRLDRFYSVVATSDGGYILAGRSRSFSDGERAYVVKTDRYGGVEWERTFGYRAATGARNIKETTDGGFVVTGWTGRTRHSQSVDLLLFKLNREGSIVWWRTLARAHWQGAHEVAETPDGGFVLTGFENSGARRFDGWIAKTDRNGQFEWVKRQGTARGWDEWHGVTVVQDGMVFTGGTVRDGRMRTWVMKTDLDGNQQWQRWYRGFGYAWHIAQTQDGGYVVTGNAQPYKSPTGSYDAFVLKLSAQGRREYGLHLGDRFVDNGRYIISTSDGGFLMAGYYGHEAGRVPSSRWQFDWNRDLWMLKIAPPGKPPSASWQNPSHRYDVNNSGHANPLGPVSPIDVLLLVNMINLPDPRILEHDGIGWKFLPVRPPGEFFYDTNGDGYLTVEDVLGVLSFLSEVAEIPA